jgi:hypothetical protein
VSRNLELALIILGFSTLGLISGWVLARSGGHYALVATLLVVTALLLWHHQSAEQRVGLAALGHAVLLVGTIWATVVMSVTYSITRHSRRTAQG